MTGQLDLFGAGVRKGDPATSKAAAESMTQPVLSAQRAKVLAAVAHCDKWRATPGATAYDVSLAMSVIYGRTIQQNVAARRLTDLAQMGLIIDSGRTRSGSSDRHLTVWFLTDAGREVAS